MRSLAALYAAILAGPMPPSSCGGSGPADPEPPPGELDPLACETCGGDGTLTYDRADARGEHYTVEKPCPNCKGEDVDIELDDFDTYNPDDMEAYEP
jgi:DnaJ-class molecular chaperone